MALSMQGKEEPARVITLPIIEANQTIRLPLWLRGAAVGLHTIGILFHYEPEARATTLQS